VKLSYRLSSNSKIYFLGKIWFRRGDVKEMATVASFSDSLEAMTDHDVLRPAAMQEVPN